MPKTFLDKKVKIKLAVREHRQDRMPNGTVDAEMTVADAIKSNHYHDPEVAAQIFQAIETAINEGAKDE